MKSSNKTSLQTDWKARAGWTKPAWSCLCPTREGTFTRPTQPFLLLLLRMVNAFSNQLPGSTTCPGMGCQPPQGLSAQGQGSASCRWQWHGQGSHPSCEGQQGPPQQHGAVPGRCHRVREGSSAGARSAEEISPHRLMWLAGKPPLCLALAASCVLVFWPLAKLTFTMLPDQNGLIWETAEGRAVAREAPTCVSQHWGTSWGQSSPGHWHSPHWVWVI